MSPVRFARRLGLGAFIATALAASAMAQDAYTTAGVNMRSGPGTGYPVVMGLPEGAGVDIVGDCAGPWCNIEAEGARGWVASAYLDRTGAEPPGASPRVYVQPRPPIYVQPAPPVYNEPAPIFTPPVYGRPPVYGGPDYDRPRWRRPPPDMGGNPPDWRRPRPPGEPPRINPPQPPVGQPRPNPPAVQPPPGGYPPNPAMIGRGYPRGGTGPCAAVPAGIPCQ
ncbi:SH3 domain-containing protein [Terrarubrum flagellatum]|uniref:SH3 domain-containing protein n=1 Tax=Terrirubrum flagellatum TaxID=2895980 RepID=UPI003145445F